MIAGQTPGDACADGAAAGDDDVVEIRHSYQTGGGVSKGFKIVIEPNSRPVRKSSLNRNRQRVRSAAATIKPSQKETCVSSVQCQARSIIPMVMSGGFHSDISLTRWRATSGGTLNFRRAFQ